MCNIITILGASDICVSLIPRFFSSVRNHFQYNTQDTESDSHSGKFRVWDLEYHAYLQSFSVESNGLLYVSLFSLDVGQVVQGVRMVRVHVQSSVVALLGLCHLVTKVEYITALLCHSKYI